VLLALYLAGLSLVAAVAWAVARPLFAASAAPDATSSIVPRAPARDADERWRKQKEEAIAAIKETEFDFHIGKLSESDYRGLRARLEARAIEAMRALGESE
jgi:hypothetical protein